MTAKLERVAGGAARGNHGSPATGGRRRTPTGSACGCATRAAGSGSCSSSSKAAAAARTSWPTSPPNGTRPARMPRCGGSARRRPGARAEAASQNVQRLRESAGDRRAASDRRLELLLGALEGAASGLRREWDLIGGGPAPADVVAAGLPRAAVGRRTDRRSDPADRLGRTARRAPHRRRLQRDQDRLSGAVALRPAGPAGQVAGRVGRADLRRGDRRVRRRGGGHGPPAGPRHPGAVLAARRARPTT